MNVFFFFATHPVADNGIHRQAIGIHLFNRRQSHFTIPNRIFLLRSRGILAILDVSI